MNENYIVINGKKIEPTEEQLRALGIEKERNNPFSKVCRGKDFFYIDAFDDLCSLTEFNTIISGKLNASGNYFNNEDFAHQVALHKLLYRKLLKFAYDNGCEDTAEWDGNSENFLIYYNVKNKDFNVSINCNIKSASIYFNSRRAAKRAVEEVVKPFVKEHPEFVR